MKCECGKKLIRRKTESYQDFERRITCSRVCSDIRRKKEEIGWHKIGTFNYLFHK